MRALVGDNLRWTVVTGWLLALLCSRAAGQQPDFQRWRIGLEITAGAGPATGLTATAPVPMDWPEQRVKIVQQDVSANVRGLRFRTLEGGVRQMTLTVPKLQAGETARAVLVVEIEKRDVTAPEDSQRLQLPKPLPPTLRKYLLPSPQIDSQHPKIRALAAEIVAGQRSPWEQAEAIFRWVRANVQYKFDRQIKSSVEALDAGVGDCEELTSLFIAFCRASGIPARAVWVPGHCYPEFYLVDAEHKGHWIPCQVAGGDGRFGWMSEPRPILQKGDNFRVPGHRKPLRYVQPTLVARRAAAPPTMRWIVERAAMTDSE